MRLLRGMTEMERFCGDVGSSGHEDAISIMIKKGCVCAVLPTKYIVGCIPILARNSEKILTVRIFVLVVYSSKRVQKECQSIDKKTFVR